MTKEQDMQKTIDVLKKDNEEMGCEIISLKRQIGGYKSQNARYKQQANNDALYVKHLQKENNSLTKEIEVLQNEIGKAKNYAKEADELNEKKALRIDTLEKALDDMTEQRGAAIKDVEKANELNAELSNKLDATNDALSITREQVALASKTNNDLHDEICACKAQINWYNNLPWYKKIFVKTI